VDEFRLIAAIKEILNQGPAAKDETRDPRVEIGIGDDAALLNVPAGKIVATTDTLVQGVHFRLDWARPRDIGAKAVAVNVSDLAAMGCSPLAALLSYELPREIDDRTVLAITKGVAQAGFLYDLPVVGGNITSTSGPLAITIAALGVPSSARVLTRGGALVGDVVMVSGHLGAATLGRLALERGIGAKFPGLVKAYRRPVARVSLGCAMAADGRVHSAIDISDGLLADLGHILDASGVGANLDSSAILLPPKALRAASLLGVDALECALMGGDDYELLAVVSEKAVGDWVKAGMRPLGKITKRKGMRLDGKSIKPSGWNHRS
jgi:thiamine-monophosphate kinase